jgi:hypothetical protein
MALTKDDVLWQEYTTLVSEASKLSDRRQVMNDIFVGLNALFLTAMGVLFLSSHLQSWWTTGVYGAITLFTVIFNLIWYRLINRYRQIVGLRIRYLRSLERALQESGSGIFPLIDVTDPGEIERAKRQNKDIKHEYTRGIYHLEDAEVTQRNKHFGFSRLERALAIVFISVYIILTLVSAGVTILINMNIIKPIQF